jgi:uncharacterized repeat protein (TIGR03806 family)
MHRTYFLAALALGFLPLSPADETKPYGLDRRLSWTTSAVVGSPDPPLPYRVRQTFAKLKVPCPIGVAHEPGTDRLILLYQDVAWTGQGHLLRIKDDPAVQDAEKLLDVDGIAYGVAFHPDYAKNGYLYVGSNGPLHGKTKTTRVIRYTVGRQPPFTLDPNSARLILEWESDGHNGGDLAFGPDGLLYVSSGDGTSDSDTNLAGQDLMRLLSKVLRIDVDHHDPGKGYSVPADNPFTGSPGVRPETWAYGFRNPWRLHIDRPTGDLWVGNNGQDLWEQVYLVRRGANYGWSVLEGSHPFYPTRKAGPHPFDRPIAEHHHSEMRSLSGGLVYHGNELPELRGAYIYGDWSTGRIWGIRHDKGRVTWHQELAATTLQITGFGTDSKGELLIADHGGGYYRLERAPREEAPARFPTRLSETGLFTSVRGHVPHPALIPYSVNAPLWSDGALKERFLALPGTSQVEFTAENGWNFPEGTVLVKTFSLELEAGNPASRRRIETRLLTRPQKEWVGYSYVWNEDQTDATLVDRAGMDRVYEVREPGGVRKQTWHYPSRAECMVCHSRAANFVLGLSTPQMNKVHQYGAVADNQLRTLEHIGVFKDKLPKRPEQLGRLVDPSDTAADLNLRARSYLHANCAQCHVEAGGGNAMINLAFGTAAEKMRLFDARPQHDTYGLKEARLVAAGAPDRSVLLHRMGLRGRGQMPPLATSVVDEEALRLLREWVRQVKPVPGEAAPSVRK